MANEGFRRFPLRVENFWKPWVLHSTFLMYDFHQYQSISVYLSLSLNCFHSSFLFSIPKPRFSLHFIDIGHITYVYFFIWYTTWISFIVFFPFPFLFVQLFYLIFMLVLLFIWIPCNYLHLFGLFNSFCGRSLFVFA